MRTRSIILAFVAVIATAALMYAVSLSMRIQALHWETELDN